jgi:DNA-binding MarR family transcriptional regulator
MKTLVIKLFSQRERYTMKSNLSNRDIMALLYVRDHKSITELAQVLGVSIGKAFQLLQNLEQNSYVLPPERPHMARSRTLTQAGREELEKWYPST